MAVKVDGASRKAWEIQKSIGEFQALYDDHGDGRLDASAMRLKAFVDKFDVQLSHERWLYDHHQVTGKSD